MKKRFGVVVFPGSNCDDDCLSVVRDVLKQESVPLWHKDAHIPSCDALIIPGGFSYGDYLRTGAIAKFSPIMKEVVRFAGAGRPVIGICNGFQILLESGLLPGAMLRNRTLKFECAFVNLRVESTRSPFTAKYRKGETLRIPIAHGEGNYFAEADTLKALNDGDRVAFRYCDFEGAVTDAANPNGSLENIAGILNEGRNVLGMMPHPERASETILGSEDGLRLFESILEKIA